MCLQPKHCALLILGVATCVQPCLLSNDLCLIAYFDISLNWQQKISWWNHVANVPSGLENAQKDPKVGDSFGKVN